MYFRAVRNVFSASSKLSKPKINKSAKLIFPASLTVPKLLARTSQYSVQNYSTKKQSLDKRVSNEQSYDDDSDEEFEEYRGIDKKNPQMYFREKDQAKLDALLQDNPEKQKLQKIINLELIVLQQGGECVPSKLQPKEWIEVLTLKSKAQRRKYYKYLFINEKIDEKAKKEKEEKQLELEKVREARKYQQPNDEIEYGFGRNFMLRRISHTYMNHILQWNALRACMFGNKIVYDCSYDDYMSDMEAKSCAKQLNEAYAANRVHNFPFEIIFANVNPASKVMETLHRYIPILYEKDFPITITEKSYLELFDRSSLCYLSSNAPTMLEEYDPKTIYIIGAYVDKGSKKPVSFGKAKREGIRMAKLPLDKYLYFGASGGKDLTLNQMCSIMLDSQCHSWPEALKHVPTRKLQESRVKALERKVIRSRFNRPDDTNAENESYYSTKKSDQIFSSPDVHDFSHSARAKLRERWNK